MSNLSKPLYTLTVGEYIELNKKIFTEETERLLRLNTQKDKNVKEDQDIIFVDEVLSLTGYQRSTLYSKICRFEIPVVSRRKPLTFSRKEIIKWLHDDKPSVIDKEMEKYLNK